MTTLKSTFTPLNYALEKPDLANNFYIMKVIGQDDDPTSDNFRSKWWLVSSSC